jgi:hypothetical protein
VDGGLHRREAPQLGRPRDLVTDYARNA